jgi:Pyrimidine dimer DNA glycosylase
VLLPGSDVGEGPAPAAYVVSLVLYLATVRLWTIHPSYLDASGLVAAWREGLLAQRVLAGGTRGYTKHPQLLRFRESGDSARGISKYLAEILSEARVRGYSFDSSRIMAFDPRYDERMVVNGGQIRYELELLKWKLERRDPERAEGLRGERPIRLNGAFSEREGPIEAWEKAIDEVLARMDGG